MVMIISMMMIITMVMMMTIMMMFWQIVFLCLLYLYVDKRIVDQMPGYLNDVAKDADNFIYNHHHAL